MSQRRKITVVGTGYVGMSMAVLLAQHNEVVALDIDAARVADILARRSTVADADIQLFLDALINFNNKYLSMERYSTGCLAMNHQAATKNGAETRLAHFPILIRDYINWG